MKTTTILASLALLFLSSCGGPTESKTEKTSVPLPSGLFSIVKGKALSISEAKALPPGTDVIIKGKVMGSLHPFVENRASFLIGDPEKITSCEVMGEDDHCKTPWDTCCESPKDIVKSSLNIQVVDDQGRALKAGLKGKGGLKELVHVIVKGKVDANSSPEATIINAGAIQVMQMSHQGHTH